MVTTSKQKLSNTDEKVLLRTMGNMTKRTDGIGEVFRKHTPDEAMQIAITAFGMESMRDALLEASETGIRVEPHPTEIYDVTGEPKFQVIKADGTPYSQLYDWDIYAYSRAFKLARLAVFAY
jgi:hypothetical protein